MSGDRSVGIATGYVLDVRGSVADRDKRVFSIPQRQDWFWSPPSLLSNGYQSVSLSLFEGKTVGD
jgi:hypothetical protein